jgi:lipopolysaccharide transport system ATP-binding protein
MSQPAVLIERMSKLYRLMSSDDYGYRTLRDSIAGLFRRRDRTASNEARELWALRDIDLRIDQGEAVGIVGHNGAGKSTLLKILTRITEPTSGRAVLHGRVASLLEVGTGFHPELTGRENIFLNGAILGMSRAEIRRDFDAIVAFSGVERFLDQPVKRYSSGMFVRLGFAVAAHLTPEILMVDEVLAVGDVEFQRRCLGRMNEVARSGRTVLFVSHNLGSIESLCPRSVLFRSGQIAMVGPTAEVIGEYLSNRGGQSLFDLRAFAERDGTGSALITGVELLSADGTTPIDEIEFRSSFCIRIRYEAGRELRGVAAGFAVLNIKGERVFLSDSMDRGRTFDLPAGEGALECCVSDPHVIPDTYRLELWISETPGVEYADHLRMVGEVEVVAGSPSGIAISSLTAGMRGSLYVDAEWSGVKLP